MKMKSKFTLYLVLFFSYYYVNGQVPASERAALEAFYMATNGNNWAINDNWMSNAPVSTWFGVDVDTVNGQDHVVTLAFDVIPNNLNGILPEELGNLTNLRGLNINNSPMLSGPIPASLGNLQELGSIDLNNNGLTGALPTELSNCPNLAYFSVEGNQLTGAIPVDYANLTAMGDFRVGGNSLTGQIPNNLFDSWINLSALSLNDMQVSGVVDLSNTVHFDLILWLQNTLISEVNLRNGQNQHIVVFPAPINSPNFSANPNLYCIYVDDASFSTNNWQLIDNQASYSESALDCATVSVVESRQSDLILYPNPTTGLIQIETPTSVQIREITIFNAIGKAINHKTSNNNIIDLSSVASGMYYVRIQDSRDTIFIQKIIKE